MTSARRLVASSMTKPTDELHSEAQAEYLAALSWYRERSPKAALRFEAEFTRSVERIQESLERWAWYLENSRRFLLHQFPFALVIFSFLLSRTDIADQATGKTGSSTSVSPVSPAVSPSTLTCALSPITYAVPSLAVLFVNTFARTSGWPDTARP
jgi:hypothetical protein